MSACAQSVVKTLVLYSNPNARLRGPHKPRQRRRRILPICAPRPTVRFHGSSNQSRGLPAHLAWLTGATCRYPGEYSAGMTRAAVIIDYQNLHYCGHDQFCPAGSPLHHCLIHPGALARRILDVRAANGRGHAELADVQVFRGLPDPEYDLAGYERNITQKRHWQTEPTVHVTHRLLQYRVLRQVYSVGPGHGVPESEIQAHEKGIDVLAAMATVTAAARDDIDLVILASHDSDLDPAVIAVQDSRQAKIEAVQWFGGHTSHGRLRGNGHLWSTRLSAQDFIACRDYADLHDLRATA